MRAEKRWPFTLGKALVTKRALQDSLRNQVARYLWIVLLAVTGTVVGSNPATALHHSCPSGLAGFQPQSGDVFLVNALSNPKRIRVKGDSGFIQVSSRATVDMELYYFATAPEPATPMLFALLRAIAMEGNTSLSADRVMVSNSHNEERPYQRDKYDSFHDEKRVGYHFLRRFLHMRFRDGPLSGKNSYDVVDSPTIYKINPDQAVENGFEVEGYKARIQRNQGIDPGGRCIKFTMFESSRFARSTRYQIATLIVLGETTEQPTDYVKIKISFD